MPSAPLRLSGTLASRGSPELSVGAFYYATDNITVYESAGGVWAARTRPLERFEITNQLSGTTAGRPQPSTCIGSLYYNTDLSQSFEAFPTAWAVYDKVDQTQNVRVITLTTDHVLALEDNGSVLRLNRSIPGQFIVPAHSLVPFQAGARITLQAVGGGQISITQASGVTINTPKTRKLRTRYSSAFVTQSDTMDTWDLQGDLEEAGGGDSNAAAAVLANTTALKAVSTAGINNRAYYVLESSVLRVWRLQAGTTAEDITAGIARPDDYAASTNEKIFSREI